MPLRSDVRITSRFSSRSPPSRLPPTSPSSAPREAAGLGPLAPHGDLRCGCRGSSRSSCSPPRKSPAASFCAARPGHPLGASRFCSRSASPLPRGRSKVSATLGPTRPCANSFPVGPRYSANCKAPRLRPCSRGPDGCLFLRRCCSRGIISGDAIRSPSLFSSFSSRSPL